MSLSLSSPAFTHETEIPKRYTCEGLDIPPPLSWSGVPKGARSLALIVDDPDAPDPAAPEITWTHWVVFNLPPQDRIMKEGEKLPQEAKEGWNDWDSLGYGGPCPPVGRHRYFFKLYALDCRLDQLGHPTKAELESIMKDHILEMATLMCTYEKSGRARFVAPEMRTAI